MFLVVDSRQRFDQLRRLFVDSLREFVWKDVANIPFSRTKGKRKQAAGELFADECGKALNTEWCCEWFVVSDTNTNEELFASPTTKLDDNQVNQLTNHFDKQVSLKCTVFYRNPDTAKRFEFSTTLNVFRSMFKVDEYKITLSEIEHLGLLFEPYLQLADELRSYVFKGLMEVHIFVAPINADSKTQDQFKDVCGQYKGMKSCNLKLDFVNDGLTGVLMSSRYCVGDMQTIWREAFTDARRLHNDGFKVIRTKIEASASIEGVPETDEQAKALPSYTYFEFHMVFRDKDGEVPTTELVDQARKLAKDLEKEWNCCIPFSQNAFGTQKFLNLRTYGIGRETSFPRLEELGQQLQKHSFTVPRFIREFGVYDSAVEVDKGWLEPVAEDGSNTIGFLKPLHA